MTVERGGGWEWGPLELLYLQDLHRPYGAQVDEARLRSGAGVSHLDLAERLLADDTVAAAARGADLVVVATTLPDLHPFTPVSPHLQERLGGTGRRFAVTEQGSAAPFTALRIAAAGHRTGRARTTAVMIAEQSTHAARDERLAAATPADAAALLVLGAGEGPDITRVAEVRGSGPDPVTDGLARAADGAHHPLVVLGPHVAPSVRAPAGAAVHRVERAAYGVGVWRELAEHHRAWSAAYDRVVLCETDALSPERTHLLMLGGAPRPSAVPCPGGSEAHA
ncbi:hypothetical protein GCM10010245_67150 [Streptomyces spectabilis]|nr:hypothetical protein GCM10010245_67150 [Streptomyces spectabilis]